MIEGRRARFSDAIYLSERLRYEDAREITGVWGCGVREGLFLCLLHSDRAFCLHQGAEPRALCGVTDSHYAGLQVGIPWLLAGEHLFSNRRWAAGASRNWIDCLLLDYDVLTNLTDAANAVHLRWLAWSGFQPLRDIPAFGRRGRRFREFYRVNPRRSVHPDSVRDLLLARPVSADPEAADSHLQALARAGVALLHDEVPVTPAVLSSLTAGLRDLQRLPDAGSRGPRSRGPRLRRAALRLLQEAAPRIVDSRAAIGRALPPADSAPAAAAAALIGWCEAFTEVGVVCALEAGLEPADVVPALVPRQVPGALLEAAAGTRQPAAAGRDTDAGSRLRLMTRHYQLALTLAGRVRPAHGYRLHAAALAVTDREVLEPLGIPRADLERLVTDHYTGRFLLGHAEAIPGGLGAVRRPVGALQVNHGDIVARLNTRFRDLDHGGGDLAPALRAKLDQRAADGPRMDCLADVLAMAGTLAEGVALQRLPGLRLGGLDHGYAQRHGLYRLLRAWILQTAVAQETEETASLLLDESAALLAVNRLDQWLLAIGPGRPGTEQPYVNRHTGPDAGQLLWHCAEEIWGPWLAGADDLDYVQGLLAPAVLVPVAHAVQLAPALLAWQLAATGALAESVAGLGKVLVDERRDPQAGVRKFLRRRYAELGMVGLHSGLDHTGQRERNKAAATNRAAAAG